MAATWSGVSLKHVIVAQARVSASSAINCFYRLTLPVTDASYTFFSLSSSFLSIFPLLASLR